MSCPDPDRLEALVASAVTAEERGALLDHAASCPECHAVLAVLETDAARASSTAATAAGDPAAPRIFRTASTVDAPPPVPGDQVGRYVLSRPLGAGAMGVVFAAHDPELDREVALKLLRPGASAERLRREAQSLARLAHPHVVRVYDVGVHAGRTFIAMELIVGDNLRRWLLTPRTGDQILDVIVRAGQGLAAAHRAGLIHRDLKPDNILVARDGNVLVGDFGLARSAVSTGGDSEEEIATAATAAFAAVSNVDEPVLTTTGMLIGTPAYMAPEQAAGDATAASDQYAFCITAWEAWFGRRPVTGGSLEELFANARAGRFTRPDDREVPAHIEAALRRGLAPLPTDRFPSMDELLAALSPRPRRRRGWMIGGAVAVAVALSATVFVLQGRHTGPSSEVICATHGEAIAALWKPEARAAVAERWGDGLAADLDRYTTSWRTDRVEACAATHVRREQRLETLEQRVACLDRARDELAVVLDILGTAAPGSLPESYNVVAGLPPLDRCGPGVTSTVDAPPPPERAADIAALDKELTTLDLGRMAGAPRLDVAAARGMRERAEKLGYPPQIARALLVEASLAAWNGETAAAEPLLRRVGLESERRQDDVTRATAAARLAVVLVQAGRLDEAANTVASGRAALERIAGDRTVDAALTAAEVQLAKARLQFREAAQHQERVIALHIALYGENTALISKSYFDLGPLWSQAGEFERGQAAMAKGLAAAPPELLQNAPFMAEDSNDRLVVGDFAGALSIDERQLAGIRALPKHPIIPEALTVLSLARLHDLDNDPAVAARYFAEAAALVDRPDTDFDSEVETPDPVRRLQILQEGLESAGRCLVRADRPADALPFARRALQVARDGGDATAESIVTATVWLGRALVETGNHREARPLLEQGIRMQLDDPQATPFGRATSHFALAQALWETGDEADRGRALALAADADRYFGESLALNANQPALRKLLVIARAEREELRAWKAKRAR